MVQQVPNVRCIKLCINFFRAATPHVPHYFFITINLPMMKLHKFIKFVEHTLGKINRKFKKLGAAKPIYIYIEWFNRPALICFKDLEKVFDLI